MVNYSKLRIYLWFIHTHCFMVLLIKITFKSSIFLLLFFNMILLLYNDISSNFLFSVTSQVYSHKFFAYPLTFFTDNNYYIHISICMCLRYTHTTHKINRKKIMNAAGILDSLFWLVRSLILENILLLPLW